MKTERAWIQGTLITTLCLWMIGCASPGGPGRPRHFHEASRASVVLQFSSWDYTFLVRPRYDENGFLQQVRRDNINQVFNQFKVRRDMAVVVIGWTYGQHETAELVAEWKSILARCGFRRAVFLRSNIDDRLNGSEVIDDSSLSLAAAAIAPPFGRPGA